MEYAWHFDVVRENLSFLLRGLGTTLALTVLCMLTGLVLGLFLTLMRLSPWRAVNVLAYAFTELFRTTPLLVQIIWVFYVLPMLTGIKFTPFYSGLIALGLNVAAFMSEIYRAGILSVSRAQSDASLALGMTKFQAMRRIILPQAVIRMVPPIATTWVSLFKDTSILSAIGVTELMFKARYVTMQTYRPLEIFTATALIYFLLTYPQSIGVNYLYKKFRTQE